MFGWHFKPSFQDKVVNLHVQKQPNTKIVGRITLRPIYIYIYILCIYIYIHSTMPIYDHHTCLIMYVYIYICVCVSIHIPMIILPKKLHPRRPQTVFPHPCGYTSSWFWQFWIRFHGEQHELQATRFHVLLLSGGIYAGVTPERRRRHEGRKEQR